MPYLSYLAIFLAGLFLCNCIPHLAAGLRGERFPTPFSKPRGIGNSSPLANFLWGSTNLSISLTLTRRALGMDFSILPFLLIAGFLMAGIYLSRHFGKVRATVK